MLVSAPVSPKVMTPPVADLVNIPVGSSGVSSLTAVLPQHKGVEGVGTEGNDFPRASPATRPVSSVPVTLILKECLDCLWLGLKSVK